MGCWICPKCSEHLGLDIELIDNHICDDKKIIERINLLESSVNNLRRRIDNLRDGIELFLFNNKTTIIGKLDVLAIPREDVETLYKLLDKSQSPIDFSNLHRLLYSTWLEAYEIFCSNHSRNYKVSDLEEQLEILREYAIYTRRLLGFEEREGLKTTKEVLEEYKSTILGEQSGT